jgi:hypothetical protein
MPGPRPVLLVGSVPLDAPADVFLKVSDSVGSLARRIPDGETGARLNWIVWQGDRFFAVPGLETQGERHMPSERKARPQFGPKPGAAPEALAFGPLGYADSAISSYRTFKSLRDAGKLPAGTRFQVSLPTPFSVVYHFGVASARRTIWPHYERRMLAEVAEILAQIPHRDLAIQWDVCTEIVRVMEDPQLSREYTMDELLQGVVRVAEAVAPDAELGIHICYGDLGHKHTLEPRDTGLSVTIANWLSGAIHRPINWIHMPVPRDRDDDAYFAPLRGLQLNPQTELYLGLVHYTDGVGGAERRLAAARKVVSSFGVATECGFGRRDPQTVEDLLALHREVAALG